MKLIRNLLRLIFLYVCDSFVRILPCQKIRKDVVLIRLDAIGDFIIWLDSAKEYRRLYPGKKITVCLNSILLELSSGSAYWDEVIPVDIRRFSVNPWYRIKILGRIRSAAFEIAIQPTFSRSFSLGDAVIRASCASRRIGSVGDHSNMSRLAKGIADGWYTTLIPAREAPLMELDRNAEFVSNLGGYACSAKLPVLPSFGQLPERLNISEPYFVVFPGASWTGRQWPAKYFVEILTKINHQYGWKPVICGGLSEVALCQSITDASRDSAVNLCGKTSLPELIELIRGAEFLIGNETSAIHIAAAVSTPSVGVVGGGHFGRFMPYPTHVSGIRPLTANFEMPCYNCNWHCSQPFQKGCAVPCVSGVTVACVLEKVSDSIRVLGKHDVKQSQVGLANSKDLFR